MGFTSEANAARLPGAAGHKGRKPVPRRRFQRGHLKVIGQQWVLYFWRDERRNGVVQRVKVSKRLGLIKILSRRAAQKAAQPILDGVNNQVEIPEITVEGGVSVREFIPEWRTGAAPALKPSTRE